MISSVFANLVRQPIIRVLTIIGSVIVARVLGPVGLAVLAVIRATTTTILTFMDLGITKSIGMILPDISVRFGKTEAVRVLKQLLYLKLALVLLGFIGLIILDATNVWQGRQNIAYSKWFFPIVGTSILLNALVLIKQQEWTAALRMSNLATLQISVAILMPLLTITAALIWQDPYLVAVAQILPLLFQLGVFLVLPGYDLDSKKKSSTRFLLGQIFSKYWRYSGITYLIFLFNGFVFGLPLTIFLLSELGIELKAIGNVAVAIAIVRLGREVANIPLANLRVPIMARMIAENDHSRFLQVQRLMVSILVLTSSVIAIGMFTLGPPALALMYGEKYKAAITWGIPIGITALFFNFFSMGNSTLRQVHQYTPVIIGLSLSLIVIVSGNLIGVQRLPETLWPPLVVLTYVLGRAVFAIATDLWADAVIFQWQGTWTKMRGLLALGLALVIAFSILHSVSEKAILNNFCAFSLSLITFIISFRFMGGVGIEVRNALPNLLSARLRWIVNIL